MTSRIHRRDFQKRSTLLLGGALLATFGGCSSGEESPPASGGPSHGILSITRGDADLTVPADVPEGKSWRYGLIFPFQVGPRMAAAFVNIRIRNGVMAPARSGDDYEVGNDVVLFDDVNLPPSAPAVPVTRNHEAANPNSNPPNQTAIMVKYPMRGGFVPLGAKNPDGSPHPHAGTGFGIDTGLARRPGDPKSAHGGGMYEGDERYQIMEVFQFSYDGDQFRVTGKEQVLPTGLVSGWSISNGGLTNAIADGADLLVGMHASKVDGAGNPEPEAPRGSGVLRWQRTNRLWRPVSFVPVTGTDESTEPSLIRDTNGDLLFSARGKGGTRPHAIRVWRSRDGGETWKKIIHVVGVISSCPITLNQAADGTPYIASNMYLVPLDPIPKRFRIPADAEGRVRGGGWTRQKLYLWPLSDDRAGLEAPILGRHCKAEFGPAPSGSMWRADHPSSTTVQLGDGNWHNVMGYRIHDDVESHELPSPPQTGAYLEEVISAGEPIPTWKF
jgi:hypothetical protein